MSLYLDQHRKWFAVLAATALMCLAGPRAFAAKDKLDEKAVVVFSPVGGAYVTNVSVKLSVRDEAETIRYTLDGSEPDENSPAYSKPLLIANTLVVRARAFRKNAPPGATSAEVYTLLDDDLAGFSSNLPLIILNSFGTNLTRDQKIEGAMQCIDGGKERTALTRPASFSGRALLNVRGRASLRYPKNSFTIKTIDGTGDP
ncbi:MAG TPA: chitobiase/beta-hexosaminidase C-terminal domain-containing protein, partial [Verrucomicrobiae bacterium]